MVEALEPLLDTLVFTGVPSTCPELQREAQTFSASQALSATLDLANTLRGKQHLTLGSLHGISFLSWTLTPRVAHWYLWTRFKNILTSIYSYSWQEGWATTLEAGIPAVPWGEHRTSPASQKLKIFNFHWITTEASAALVGLPSGCNRFPAMFPVCSGCENNSNFEHSNENAHVCGTSDVWSDAKSSSHLSLAIDFFKTALLSCNLHTVKFTRFEGPVQWLSVNLEFWSSPQSSFRTPLINSLPLHNCQAQENGIGMMLLRSSVLFTCTYMWMQ